MITKWIGRTLRAVVVTGAILALGVGVAQATGASTAASCLNCQGFGFTAECEACCNNAPGWCGGGVPCLCG